ncbi:hypothetical protein C0991_010427 [Blastosporella zonata]|nr:hypothetical protein C0991_010427 [Blastosporella zonata]
MFPHPLDINNSRRMLPLTTLREFTMLKLINKITDKPNWHIKVGTPTVYLISDQHNVFKVFDDIIAKKWKGEMLSMDYTDVYYTDVDYMEVTESMTDWCIAELQYKAKIFEQTAAVSVFNGDVVKSDTIIPQALNEALKAAVAPLEQVPSVLQDWHPRSDDKVLDLVHPSLYPLVYGRSRILPNATIGLDDCIESTGQGEVIPVPPPRDAGDILLKKMLRFPFSQQFQWLPCDVSLSDDGNSVKIVSYINNLHPEKHKDLYAVIEKIIGHTIPLWNLSLTPLKAYRCPSWNRIILDRCCYDPDPEYGPETDGPQQGESEDEDDFYERREQWYRDTRRLVLPEPGPFKRPGFKKGPDSRREDNNRPVYELEGKGELKPEYSVDIFRDFASSGLQVIVKLANIHLTVEKPVYEGGTWHVEGQMNEHICASAIYYYDNHNISDSRLAFRQLSDPRDADYIDYPQNDHNWLTEVFGCYVDDSVQDVGAVDTPEGRLLTWPNILQHQVQPFALADPTKPGHRKILAFFLVDPNIRIISTANIPCQQREWWVDAIYKSVLSGLPAEIKELIIQDVEEDFPINLKEAKEARLELMEERGIYVEVQDHEFHSYDFSLCEH